MCRMEKDILQDIIDNKRIEIAHQKRAISSQNLLSIGRDRMERKTVSLRKAISEAKDGIIAEFVRKSPTSGWLCPEARVKDVIPAFEQAGACACSIQTDGKFYDGALGDLWKARQATQLPLLRKDLILDSYQLLQSRVMGADAVLLIASTLTPEDCRILTDTAHGLQMEVVLEIHEETELVEAFDDVDVISVNNRNLGSFHADWEKSLLLAEKLKGKKQLLITEFEISNPTMIQQFHAAGFQGFLLGDTFMKTNDPGKALTDFIQQL